MSERCDKHPFGSKAAARETSGCRCGCRLRVYRCCACHAWHVTQPEKRVRLGASRQTWWWLRCLALAGQ